MKKSTYLLFALALIIFSVALYFYRKSYREIILYTDLVNNSHVVLTGLEKLSGDLKASQIIPHEIDSSKINGLAEVYKRNAGNISADLANLQNNVLDPQNKRRVDTLNHQINQHLAWMLESNVHDTILLGRAPAELQALLGIQNLIDSSIARARTVMDERRETLESTLWLNNLYILAFRVFSLIIILVTIALVFWHARQQARSRAFLDSILNSSQNGIITYKAVRKKSAIVDFKIIYANEAISAQIGMQPSQLIGKTVLHVNPQAKEIGLFDKLCSVTERQENSHYEVTSSRGIFDVRLAKFMDGVTASFFNITELRNSGEQLRKKVVELEQSNYDLEQYAYVASHDLQEPLRKIRIFGGLIRDKSGHALDATSRLYLERLIEGAERMTNLINQLLKFSRLFKPEKQFIQVELNEVLKNVLKDFDLMIQEKNVGINAGKLPAIEANPLQMNQLFYNLIHNALKFSKSQGYPTVDISARKLSKEELTGHVTLDKKLNYYELFFKDDGIGFNQEFANQIFEIFKRLNEQHIYPGSGIGLALCRKIVLNHHGLIWAEGKEKEGACFHVILPAHQPGTATSDEV